MDYETASEYSDASSINTLFTCLTCQVAFHNADAQREHYRVDWHRYNLKRKVAGLQPISAEIFRERVLAQQEKDRLENEKKSSSLGCEECNKVFNTENAYKNHLVSKKHRENVANFKERKERMIQRQAKAEKKEPVEKINWKKKLAEASTEEEVNKVIDEKIKMAIKLEETDCLFCDFKGETFDEKLEHMTEKHTFFIPDIEYLVDLKGLIKYLSDKISIGNTCIYCKKSFHSLEAIRKHMLDKGHCKIMYEDGADLEISDYYDFSSTYEQDGIDPDEELDPNYNVLTITSEGTELVLPSGAHIGHRDYRRYYNQNLRLTDEPESVAINRLTQKYQALGYYNIGSSGMTIEKERLEKMKETRAQLRDYQIKKESLGIKANKLQKHFRAQIM